MKEEIVKIVENKGYLTELLSKNTLEEIVEFCKSKGVEMTIDDAKEFVELIRSLKYEAEKIESEKGKLDEDELLDKVVGGYVYGYENLGDEIKRKKAISKVVVQSIISTAGSIIGIATASGIVYQFAKKHM